MHSARLLLISVLSLAAGTACHRAGHVSSPGSIRVDAGELASSFDGAHVKGGLDARLPTKKPAGLCGARPHAPERKPPSTVQPPTAGQQIVFARRDDQWDGGDLWLVDADGESERRLTTGETFHALAVDGRRIACLRWGKPTALDTNVYVLAPPDWRPRRVTVGGAFGMPCWKPGTDQLFAGRGTDDPSCDEGLYEVNVRRRTRRRLLAPVHGELIVADKLRLSPRGRYLVGGSVITGWLGFTLLDLKTGKPIRPRGMRGMSGGRDMAWLDEHDLLLASTPDDPTREGNVVGGIRRLSLRTRRLTRWLFSPDVSVVQLCRSPRGNRFAVGLGDVDTPASLPGMAARIEVVDARTKARHPLKLPGPAHLCGFSRDGTRLLLLVLSRTLPPTKDDLYRGMKSDAYVVDLRSGRCHRVARQAFDAAWIKGG